MEQTKARMTSSQIETHTQYLEVMVRETGYNLCGVENTGNYGELYSRARSLYDDACKILRLWCEIHQATERAEDFISRTYGYRRDDTDDESQDIPECSECGNTQGTCQHAI